MILVKPTRRALAAMLAALPLALAAVGPAHAQLQLRIGSGSFQPLPIAIADFSGDAGLASLVGTVINNNLRRSGYFVPLDKAKFPERPGFDGVPSFES